MKEKINDKKFIVSLAIVLLIVMIIVLLDKSVCQIEPEHSDKISVSSREAFNLINDERKKEGLLEYKWSPPAAEAAKIRAEEITKKYSHVRPNGKTIIKAGMDGIIYAGEMLAVRSSASSAVSAWMADSQYKSEILNTEFKKCAVAKCGDCWVALFIF